MGCGVGGPIFTKKYLCLIGKNLLPKNQSARESRTCVEASSTRVNPGLSKSRSPGIVCGHNRLSNFNIVIYIEMHLKILF